MNRLERTLLCAIALSYTLSCATAERFRDVPCARIDAVHGGAYSFTVELSVQRVRALRCVLTVNITHIPARGTRYGERAATTCFADGLGCIALTPPIQLVVDVDLPTYERTIVEVPILSQFDDHARSVPFMHMAMQITESASPIDAAKLPHASWVPRLIGFTFGNENKRGISQLITIPREKLVSIFSPRSKYVTEIDESISPRVVVNDGFMLPTVLPRQMMHLVNDGGRSFEFILTETEHFFPWVNETREFPTALRVVVPHFNELMLGNCKAIDFIDKMLASNISVIDIVELMNATSESYDFFDYPLEVFIDGVQLDFIGNETLKTLFFRPPVMRTRGSPTGLGYFSNKEWIDLLGSTASSWNSVGCQGSAQCSVTGITMGKHSHQLGRSIPYHVSASQPSCIVMRPQKPAAEVAHVRIGVAVYSGDVSHASINTRVTLSSDIALHDLPADDDTEGLLVRVLTNEDSVPGFLREPSDHLYMLNCFSRRGEVALEIQDENPYIRAPNHTTMAILENQRGVLILPNTRTEFHLGSGCGSLNFGMAFWRHIANRMQDASYNVKKIGIDLAVGAKNAHAHHEAFFGDINSAFTPGGHSCIPSGSCTEYSPASLFHDEIMWLRGKGVLPPRFPIFNPDAPGLVAGLNNTRAYRGTPKERANFAIKDVFPNIKKTFPKALAGCGRPGGDPMTMAGDFWQTNRKNLWVASNRHGNDEGRKLYIEDTHWRLDQRITHGVTFSAHTELKLAHFPHKDVSINDTGCVYLPATTLTSDPLLACAITRPRVAGTAYASVELTNNETYHELILVVECVGPAYCPLWLANESVVTDALTGEVITAHITTAKDGSIYSKLPSLKHYLERLLPNGTIGNHGLDIPDIGELPDFPSDGPILAEHLIFRFNQTVQERRYAWEAQGDKLRTILPNYFHREYLVQLYSGSLHHAISSVAKFNCHGSEKCTKRPFIPPKCDPIPLIIVDAGYNASQAPQRTRCGFFDVECQYDNREMQFLFTMEVVVPIVILGGIWYWVLYRPNQKAKHAKHKTE